MRRNRFSKNPIALVAVFLSASCSFVLIFSVLRLPDVSFNNGAVNSIRVKKISKSTENNVRIGQFGEMMIKMLPHDLSFTIFIPSEKAFDRDLRLRVNDSFVGEKANDTYAILTRVLGFTVVPWEILSETVPNGAMVICHSLSGFLLHVSKDAYGMLIVNGVRSERVDLKKSEIVLHVMDGVIMEADFEQSVRPYEEEED